MRKILHLFKMPTKHGYFCCRARKIQIAQIGGESTGDPWGRGVVGSRLANSMCVVSYKQNKLSYVRGGVHDFSTMAILML